MESDRKVQYKKSLRSILEQTIDDKTDRYFEIDHQGIIANHHFAAASSECIDLYRDGYFISAVMVSQAVNEGIVKLIAECNNIENSKHQELIDTFKEKKIITQAFATASEQIWKSFRNDIHHMNPKVSLISFQELAKKNIQNLAVIEKEIFGVEQKDGILIPNMPMYWDIQEDGSVTVFLRLY